MVGWRSVALALVAGRPARPDMRAWFSSWRQTKKTHRELPYQVHRPEFSRCAGGRDLAEGGAGGAGLGRRQGCFELQQQGGRPLNVLSPPPRSLLYLWNVLSSARNNSSERRVSVRLDARMPSHRAPLPSPRYCSLGGRVYPRCPFPTAFHRPVYSMEYRFGRLLFLNKHPPKRLVNLIPMYVSSQHARSSVGRVQQHGAARPLSCMWCVSRPRDSRSLRARLLTRPPPLFRTPNRDSHVTRTRLCLQIACRRW